jgi:membrane-bound lytic murein transglycosylase D
VRFGESFAQVAHRFATTERALRELNELGDADAVHAGFSLMVPAVDPHDDAVPADTVVAVPDATFSYPDRRRIFYRPTRTDRLSDIARFFGVTESELRTWNNVDPRASLQDGMFLQLFVPPSVDLTQAVVLTPDEVRVLVVGSEEFYEYQVAQEGRVRLRYRVAAGDTLSEIGERFGITVGSLCRINLVPRDAVLRLGQEIIVYTTRDRVPEDMRDEAEDAPAEEVAEASDDAGEGESETESATESESADEVTETDPARVAS